MTHLFRVLAGLACLGAVARATSVRPPTFEELVDGSTVVFRGRVTAVQSGWSGEGASRHLATRVTFAVERVLKGSAPADLTLEFMGGERDGRRFEIVGVPRFAVGERGVYFVEDRAGRLCPITRLGYGRYRLALDFTGTERVARDDHSPLRELGAVHDLFAEHPAIGAAPIGISLPDFERAIVARTVHGLPVRGPVR